MINCHALLKKALMKTNLKMLLLSISVSAITAIAVTYSTIQAHDKSSSHQKHTEAETLAALNQEVSKRIAEFKAMEEKKRQEVVFQRQETQVSLKEIATSVLTLLKPGNTNVEGNSGPEMRRILEEAKIDVACLTLNQKRTFDSLIKEVKLFALQQEEVGKQMARSIELLLETKNYAAQPHKIGVLIDASKEAKNEADLTFEKLNRTVKYITELTKALTNDQ